MTTKKNSFLNLGEYSHLIRWLIEMSIMSVALLVIGLITVAISGAQSLLIDPVAYEFYYKTLSWVKKGIFLADVLLFLIFFCFFTLKLLKNLFWEILPDSISNYFAKSTKPAKERFPKLDYFSAPDVFYMWHTSVRSERRVWLAHKVCKDASPLPVYRTKIEFDKDRTEKDVESREAHEYELTLTEYGSYLIIVGTPLTRKFESRFVSILYEPREGSKGDRCGILFHDTWNKDIRAFSPCVIKEEMPQGFDENHSFIWNENACATFDNIWTSLNNHDNLLPTSEPLEFRGIWIYYFRGFKNVDVYGIFKIFVDPLDNNLCAEGRAWYFGLEADKPIVRGYWSGEVTSSRKFNMLSLIFLMTIQNPSELEKNKSETKYSGVLVFEKDAKDQNRLEGKISNVDGNVKTHSHNVYAYRVESFANLDECNKFDDLRTAFSNSLEVDIAVNEKMTQRTKRRATAHNGR